ncbi:MAG: secretion system protein, partial [Sphingopyxis sp.]|nr:secretion system protein [Sphingopyxis sp.]
IKLPTDAYRNSDDLSRLLLSQNNDGVTGGDRPKPRLDASVGDADRPRGTGDASPGFSIK